MGSAFTSIGTLNFLEITQPIPVVRLPAYGLLPFASFDFNPTRLEVQLYYLSVKEGFVDVIIDMDYSLTGPTWKEQIIGFQIPHEIQIDKRSYVKVLGHNTDGSDTVIEIRSDMKISARNDTTVIYFNFTAPPEIRDQRIIVGFRWMDVIDKRDFYSYDVVCPFQISQIPNVVEEQLPEVGIYPMGSDGLAITLGIAMPSGSNMKSSIPPPDKEEIKWLSILGDTKQYRFVTFRQIIPFGRLAESPELDCYRVTMELTEEKERYEKLLFNSGLFLGLGVSLMLSGIYEAIKYEKDRKRSN